MGVLSTTWNQYTFKERRNIAIYVTGLCLYKFGLELFVGAIITLATNRFTIDDRDHAYLKVGALSGLNQTFQCIGSILIAPLIKRYHTRTVLSCAVIGFGILTAILLICDASTGGYFRSDGQDHYGSYPSDAIFPVYTAAGISYGMVELIRRVIPRDIVGGHVRKLKQMDAMVHIFYEICGTAGALSCSVLINRLGNNYAFLATPACFFAAGVVWRFVDSEFSEAETTQHTAESDQSGMEGESVGLSCGGYISGAIHGFKNFGKAVWYGAWVVFSKRKFVWLVPAYSFALFGHRYLENNLANIFATAVLKDPSFQQIMVGGSNFGELCGAVTVFFTVNYIPTPIPFLRLDAIMLLIIWYLPFYHPPANQSIVAWKMAATFIPISFGWAAGDVSLAAYIQASLARGGEATTSGISTLGAVMSFLYVTYIVTYAILSPVLGNYVDLQVRHSHVHHALLNVGGVHFTVLSVMILVATLIPHGALRLNPQLISDELGNDFEEVFPPEHLRLGKPHPISEKDRYSSSIAATEPATEPDYKRETSFDASIASPSTPTSPISPISRNSLNANSLNGPTNGSASGVFNSADDRERERERVLMRQRSASRERRPKSAGATNREYQQPVFETRVHMPTGIRVDLNVSARALPVPPRPPSPNSSLRPHPF